ncbi:MAG: ABC transporter ATP-binding protein, partial [Sphingobacteriales bacterium]
RLAIAAALLGGPRVLVLDEPTNGLDPSGIAEIRELIRTLNRQGMTIIMASHLLDEVEKVCTHVAILKKGDLLLNGPVDDVLRSEDQIELKAGNLEQLKTTLETIPGVGRISAANGYLQVSCTADLMPAKINEYCMQQGIVLSHLVMKKKSLETKFMELTG